jgi:hypothetical protein
MPVFFFNLKHRGGVLYDPQGTDLADEHAARCHADQIVRELMRNREARTRFWRLQVCDARRAALFELSFAELDDTLAELRLQLRTSVRDVCAKSGVLTDMIGEVQQTLLQIRGTLSRADNSPWLALVKGDRTERHRNVR